MVNNTQPVISVVMSVYNGEMYLKEAVESILGQTFAQFEFLIINDGSTDNSLKILKACASKDPRIHILDREHRGLVTSLNEGVALARGGYIARMDADDVSLPGRFAAQKKFLDEHSECVAVGTAALCVDPEGWPLGRMRIASGDAIDARHMLGYGGMVAHPTAMFRTSALRVVEGYASDYPSAEDFDLFLRLAEVGKLANIEEVLFRYRMHAKSVTCRHSEEQMLSTRKAIQAARIRRGLSYGKNPVNLAGGTDNNALRHVRWAFFALRNGYFLTCLKHLWLMIVSVAAFTNHYRRGKENYGK